MKWYERLDAWLWHRYAGKKPDLTVETPNGEIYLMRWHVIPRNRFFNVYYHYMQQSDQDRHLHDHRADNISIILWRGFVERFADRSVVRKPGDIVFRRAEKLHRIELLNSNYGPLHSCSLFIKLPDRRTWGFATEGGWVDHVTYEKGNFT